STPSLRRHGSNPVRQDLGLAPGRATRRRARPRLYRPPRAARTARAARLRAARQAAAAGAPARPHLLHAGSHRRHQARPRRRHQSVGRGAAADRRTGVMQPFTTHTGIAVPLLKDDVNTDQIAPVQSMRNLKPDYKALLFMRARRRDDGSEDPDFVLNRPQFRQPGILVTGHNFGTGSSREAAVWGMLANNIRVIVARSFADIYR